MELRKNILSAILLAIGYILHSITPSIGGVTFDLPLAMLFVIIAINMDFKNTLVASIATGIITGLTSKFPGGLVANMIDKPITGILVYLMLLAITSKYSKQIGVIAAGFIGTIISGSTFLYTAMVLVGLPAPFPVLFAGIVLPTAVTNVFVTLIVYNTAKLAIKATGAKFVETK
jgi:hypothetical protein